jgi:hypothetical protein
MSALWAWVRSLCEYFFCLLQVKKYDEVSKFGGFVVKGLKAKGISTNVNCTQIVIIIIIIIIISSLLLSFLYGIEAF